MTYMVDEQEAEEGDDERIDGGVMHAEAAGLDEDEQADYYAGWYDDDEDDDDGDGGW
jgi:hypothetical protein